MQIQPEIKRTKLCRPTKQASKHPWAATLLQQFYFASFRFDTGVPMES